ncbi:MAG: hypothetical protein K2G90_04025 [Muribaculaceae bacterium]|nr:hypothetical protein [Muribaculaceae bacterium]
MTGQAAILEHYIILILPGIAPFPQKNGLPFNAPEELTDVTITFDPATSKATFSDLPKDIDVTQPFIKEEGCFILEV